MTTSVQKTKESIRRSGVTDALTTLATCVAKFDKIKRKSYVESLEAMHSDEARVGRTLKIFQLLTKKSPRFARTK
jgi:hypothetical protein